MKNILLTGATGFVGKELIELVLNSTDYNLVLFSRHNLSFEHKRVHCIIGDIHSVSMESFRHIDIHIVIHLAALMADKDHLSLSEFKKTNVEGTEKLILSLSDSNIKHFIHISTVGIYSKIASIAAKEDDPGGNDLSNYEKSKAESEITCIRLCKRLNIPYTILRLGLLFGEEMKHGWPNVINAIRRNKFRIIGDGKPLIQLTYVKNIIHGIVSTINNKETFRETINLCDDEVYSIGDIFYFISDQLGVKQPSHIPYWPVYSVAFLLELLSKFIKLDWFRLLSPGRVRFFKENHIYDTRKAENLLGYKARIPTKQGIKNMIHHNIARSKQ